MDSAGMAMAALPCFGHGNLSFAGIVRGNVVVVVVVDVGTVVVVVDVGTVVVVVDVVVVVSLGAVVERAIVGVATTKIATNRPLRDTASTGPRRSNDRGVNFTQLPYFARPSILVTAP
jgi:hypothetical protein